MSDSLCYLPVHSGGEVVAHARVDPDDWFALARYRWILSGGRRRQYAAARMHGPMVYLHRHLLGLQPGDGQEADHINGDKLDNRRSNLRAVSKAANAQNRGAQPTSTSAHRGVSWNAARELWVANVKVDGRMYYLGGFNDEDEAARVAAAFRAEHMPYSAEAMAA